MKKINLLILVGACMFVVEEQKQMGQLFQV